jgi:hypothetical protein
VRHPDGSLICATVLSARLVTRLVRQLWRVRGRFEGQYAGVLSEIATALDTLIETNPVARAALRAYRLAMRALLAAAVLLVVAGLALELGLRDSTVAVVIGIVLIAIGLFVAWQWWIWSLGLRLLREHVDESRRVPPGELPGRFASLASEARPASSRVADELQRLAQSMRER